jgi:hypothetical protein
MPPKIRLTNVRLLSAIVAFALLHAPSWACAGCREPGEEVEATTVMAGLGFSWGVVFMLLFLFALCSGLGWFVARTIKAVDAGKSAP